MTSGLDTNPSATTNCASVVVAARTGESQILSQCLNAIFSHTHHTDHETILVAPHAADLSGECAGRVRHVECAVDDSVEASFNMGLRAAQGDTIALVNEAVIVEQNWLSPLTKAAAKDPSAGVLGGRLQDTRGILRSAGLTCTPEAGFVPKFKGEKKASFQALQQSPAIAFDLGLMVTRREVIEKVGLFDEGLSWFAGIDFCLRALDAGFTIRYIPQCLATDVRPPLPGDDPRSADPASLSAYLEGMDRFYAKWSRHDGAIDHALVRKIATYRAGFQADAIKRLRQIGALDPALLLRTARGLEAGELRSS